MLLVKMTCADEQRRKPFYGKQIFLQLEGRGYRGSRGQEKGTTEQRCSESLTGVLTDGKPREK